MLSKFISRFALLAVVCSGLLHAASVSGVVTDRTGAVVSGANVTLLTSQQAVVATQTTDASGAFHLDDVGRGTYVLRLEAAGFTQHRHAIQVRDTSLQVRVQLSLAPIREELTVTATPGLVQDTSGATQAVNVIGRDEIAERALAVTAQVAREEPGVELQRTSPTVGGIFVRGLTGNKVNVFVDGVRYSTSAARGGINTFLNLVDATNLEAIEILRGPNSAQYGSDALGGSVQFISLAPVLRDSPAVHGSFSVLGNTADASAGPNLTLNYGTKKFAFDTNLYGRRVNRLRPGGGIDSHSAFTRFFGLPSDAFISERVPDTAFTQYGGLVRANWAPSQQTQVLLHYSRGQQDGGRRYDQLLGGDGNLVADLRNLMLDLFYARLDRTNIGWLDHASVTYSLNSQREERVNQGGNGNALAAVNHEYERTRVHGVSGYVNKRAWRQEIVAGAEFYHERMRSPSHAFDPVTGAWTLRRGRVPDRALYRSGGAYISDISNLVPGVLQWNGSVRFSAASYRANAEDSPLVNGMRLWPDDRFRTDDVTFRTGMTVTVVDGFNLSANVSRGFRAPHMTDLGTLGLTGSGFEVAAPDVAGLGAMLGSSASRDAVSTNEPVEQLKPETSLAYEFSARLRSRMLETDTAVFINDIYDNITKQALILPAGAVGLSLGGEPIVSRLPNGTVFVGLSSSPVLVRANFDDARLWGAENRTQVRLGPSWSVTGILTYVHAKDVRTGLPPNIEGGTPAPNGYLRVRYSRPGARWWIEPYIHAAARQERLSSLDLEDRRTGATRSRSNITNFFRNGATVRGYVGQGPDGVLGTSDDVLLKTGETLAEIQQRVLGSADSSPLYTAVPGFVTFNLRGAVRIGERQQIFVAFENIGDRNYRGISWGIDAPGRTLAVRYSVNF